MKGYNLGEIDEAQYASLSEEEKLAWLNPRPDSYHSLHVERMGAVVFRWRDSRQAKFYIGSIEELAMYLSNLSCRKVDPAYLEARNNAQVLKILSQDEIDDLLSDL